MNIELDIYDNPLHRDVLIQAIKMKTPSTDLYNDRLIRKCGTLESDWHWNSDAIESLKPEQLEMLYNLLKTCWI